jgi:diaminopimelate epimerase
MRIFNSDGKEAAQCGNGLRCLVDFIKQNTTAARQLTIETQERIVSCSWDGAQITVDLGSYEWIHENFSVSPFSLQLIHTGVPHAVAFVDRLDISDFKSIASKLRFHDVFAPEGANVNFAHLRNGKLYTRTYERGVEDETLACGTGAAAVAVAAMKKYQLKNPICIVPASQEELFVEVTPKGVYLTGCATFVFLGSVCYNLAPSK